MKLCKLLLVLIVILFAGSLLVSFKNQVFAGAEDGSYYPNKSGSFKCWACNGTGHLKNGQVGKLPFESAE